MQKRLECTVLGRVQMVMYRDFVAQAARKMRLVGTVQNNPDESVSIVAEGDEALLKELLVLIKRGPLFARVDKVDEVWSEPLGGYTTFNILF